MSKGRQEIFEFTGNTELQNEFVNETDRAAVIIGASVLDVQLENLLKKFFINDPKEVDELICTDNASSPLGTFSAKIRAAYCLGLISKNVFNDLQTVRKIRNIFAHNLLGRNFNNTKIKNFVDNFSTFNELKSKQPSHEKMPYRIRFHITVYTIEGLIKNKLEKIDHTNSCPNNRLG